jgi:N-acetylmuramoyl-L-alanine amidase
VTLNFTRELAKQLRKTGKYKVYLTRNRDIYIPLRQRVNIARKHNADLFISIHADAIKRKNVRGMSIYTLSETASDKEASALAKKENQSDIIAGIDFADQPPEVANILIDLAQRETKNLSVKFANLVVDNARGKTRLLDRTHRFAGFRVLKAPDVPSVLIELGFLTNRSDEKQLLSTAWRRKVAGALVNSVNGFFDASRLAALR